MPPLDRRTLLLGLAAILLLAAAVTFIRGRGGDARPPVPIPVAAAAADGAGGVAPAPEEPLVVYVTGAVRRPGVYQLPDGKRIIDAIEKAGGVTPKADAVTVNLAALLIDGEQILVPEAFAPGAGAAPTGAGPGVAGVVHLNSADVTALDALPGVGPATAQRIVDWRDQNGGFRTVDDLEQVPGIGPAKLDALRDLVAP
ncbi:MAG: helix-hairpin-helix domain-containing protein [Gaiellales bacterium]